VQLHILGQPLEDSTDVVAFASWEWEDDEDITHCLFRPVENEVKVDYICIHPDPKLRSYKMELMFQKDADRSLAAENADPVDRFKNMWDGAEDGWRLVQYDRPVFLAEFNFTECGPTWEEIPSVVEVVGTRKDESEQQLWERLRDCTEIGNGAPLNEARMECLRQHQREHDLDLNVITIAPDDYLVLTPDASHYGWICFPEYCRPVIERMLDAGVPIVSRHLE
jgi:hypothetical protein